MSKLKRGWGYVMVVGILRPFAMLLTKRDWRGMEHVPPTGGLVLVTNHVSEIDPVTFGHYVNDLRRWPRFLGKIELFNVPVLGWIIRSAKQIPVYRQSHDATKAFSAAVDAVRRGEAVVVYPEGTISRDPDLWPMVGKFGAARIALATGCPVIPFAQWGPNEILAPYARRPRLFPRKTVHVWAGAPVDLTDLRGQPSSPAVLREATDRIMAAITKQLEGIRGLPAPAKRFDPREHGIAQIGNPNDPHNRNRPSTARAPEGDASPDEDQSGREGGVA